ncbi:MAG: iron-containing alcohol dehydrogenase, partial [Pseudomonadota bacterium]
MTLISLAGRVHFADHVLEPALRTELEHRGLSRPLMALAPGAWEGLADRLLPALPAGGDAHVFETDVVNAEEGEARRLARRYAEAERDCIVAIGPGALIDQAKAAALAVATDEPLSRCAAVAGGQTRIPRGLPPLIAAPLDAGAGAEVGPALAVTVTDGRRLVVRSRRLAPVAAICDPSLTLDLGPRPTAEGAMDAIAHCLEAYVASGCHPPAEGMALAGLRGASRALRRVLDRPGDLDARREMMAAALNAGLAQDKGLGAAHAAAHALAAGPGNRRAHGGLLAALLPHALAFNAPAADARYADLAAALDLPPRADLAASIGALAAEAGLAPRLRDLGVADEDLFAAAEA